VRCGRRDWFSSTYIVVTTAVSALALVLMIPWELGRRTPMIDLRMMATRQVASSLTIMLALGVMLLSTTQVLPQLVQQNFGYTATWSGMVLSPGGVVTMFMMPIAGRLSGFIQPRYLIAFGAAACALSMYQMTRLTGDVDFWFFASSRLLVSVGVPLIFIPITVAAYDGIARDKTDQASAMVNAARNVGGSIGISVVNNVLAHREQFHQSRLVENAIPSNTSYGLTPTKQRRDRTRRRRNADLKRPAWRQWRDTSWRRLLRWCRGRLVRRRRDASSHRGGLQVRLCSGRRRLAGRRRDASSDRGRLQDRLCGGRQRLAGRRRDASSDRVGLQDRLCGDRRRLVRRRRDASSAPSGLRPSSLVMCNTPVEVQFIASAGCLNYPCRTPSTGSNLPSRMCQIGFQ
jgi:Major Facilitator Superfamily